jgi:hypothetical protein
MDIHGRPVKTVDIGMEVDDMAGDSDGGLYVSCMWEKCIKYVSPQLEVSTVTTTGDYPLGLVYSADHDGVIVCTTTSLPVSDLGDEQLLLVSRDGTVRPHPTTQGCRL